MTVSSKRQLGKLIAATKRPCLELLRFSSRELLHRIRESEFPDVVRPVSLRFVDCGPLACILHGDDYATICVHQLLNHHETPEDVVAMVIRHELLHLRIRSVWNDGVEDQHPPDFRAAEAMISPDRHLAWCWIHANFEPCLRIRRRIQRIDVSRDWRKFWCRQRLSIAESLEVVGVSPNVFEGLC
jgi:hypothetical protein